MAYRNYDTAVSHIVDPNGFGDFTTIGSALTAAGAGQNYFYRPGTYTENLTLPANINLTAYGCDSSLNGTGTVIIKGTCTLSTVGTVTISGVQLQTNSAYFLTVSGSVASIVNLNNCYLNCTNNIGIDYTSSSGSSGINVNNCWGNLGTTGIGYFTHSSAGALDINFCNLLNSGASTTASTASAGTLNIYYTYFNAPITTSSTNSLIINYSDIDCGTNVAIALTVGGSGTNKIFFSNFKRWELICIKC